MLGRLSHFTSLPSLPPVIYRPPALFLYLQLFEQHGIDFISYLPHYFGRNGVDLPTLFVWLITPTLTVIHRPVLHPSKGATCN
jgi:hypothetical protein